MSQINVNSIKSSDGATDLLTLSSGSLTGAIATGGRRNLIINGAMQVAQRGTGATNAAAGGVYLIDRFESYASGGGVFTAEQSSTVPNNEFAYSSKLTVTTADSSIASGDYYSFNHHIEGYNVSQAAYGTSDAKSLTLSFWVRSSVTGTYCVTAYNNDGSRGYLNTFSISSANTWTKVNLTWDGDTGGTWLKTNGRGITLRFDLGSGSASYGTANQWTTSGTFAANRTSGSVDWIATNGATFYITGVQLEVGSVATPFEHRSYGEELALCSRYFQTISGITGMSAGATLNNIVIAAFTYPTPMRATPSFSQSGVIYFDHPYVVTYYQSSTGITAQNGNQYGCFIFYNNFSSLAYDKTFAQSNTALTYLDAEL